VNTYAGTAWRPRDPAETTLAAHLGPMMSNAETSRPNGDGPSPTDVSAALDRILASEEFARARRLSDFLRYVVEGALEDGARRKGYTIGVEALGRSERFDPDIDPVVRVTASRLRAALARYYAGEGRGDPVVIAMPPGGYIPTARWARARGPRIGARARSLWERLLAILGARLLRPPSQPPRKFDDREIQQIQQAQGAPPARPRGPRRD
jgi:hypothetical protein